MKPFTIRKAAQPSRAGTHGGLASGDLSMDASMGKYATADPNYGPLRTALDDNLNKAATEDETLLEQADLEKLAEEFPGKTPENPWIKEQTNRQFLTNIKVSPLFRVWCPSPSARPYTAGCLHPKRTTLTKIYSCCDRGGGPDRQIVAILRIIIIEIDELDFNLITFRLNLGTPSQTCKCLPSP